MHPHLTTYTHQNKNFSQTAYSYPENTLFSFLLLKPYSPLIRKSSEIDKILLIKILIQTSDNLTGSSHGCFTTRNYKHLFCFESTRV